MQNATSNIHFTLVRYTFGTFKKFPLTKRRKAKYCKCKLNLQFYYICIYIYISEEYKQIRIGINP